MKTPTFNNACDQIYSSLDVRFTKVCDNNCPFCIEKEGLKSLGSTNVEKMIQSTIETGIKDVLILGGEPFLEINKLLIYINGIRNFVDKIYITTSLPRTIVNNWDVFCNIINLIDGLNISLQSTNWEENNQLYCAGDMSLNRITLLKNILRETSKVRVSVNLTRINQQKYLSYIHDLMKMNVPWIKINELQDAPDIYFSFEQLSEVKQSKIKFESPYAYGCQTNLTSEQIKRLFPSIAFTGKITIKRSCFKVESSLKASLPDLWKAILNKQRKSCHTFRVLYENGMISNAWQKEVKEK